MANLFVVENNIAKPNTETLLTEPFKTIWERDTTPDKVKAMKEFTFIEFMVSKKKSNPYAGYDEDIRFDKLKEQLFNEEWQPDILIEQAMAKIHEFQTEGSATYSYYLAVLEGAQKMKQFFTTFDINEVNEKGTRVFKPNEIVMAISNTDKILQNLSSMKEKVEQELFEQSRTRGNRQTNYFEM